jgi:hypothetical protein
MEHDFPSLFAISNDDERHVWTFAARQVGTVYVVSPVTIQTDTDPPAIKLDDHHPFSDHTPVTIANEFNQLRTTSRWSYTGTTIYSFMCPTPLPLVHFHDNPYLECRHHNMVSVNQGTPFTYRFWERRWDPDIIFSELTAAHTRRPPWRTPPAAGEPPVTVASHTGNFAAIPVAIPSYVAKLLIADAVATNAVCPITLEPIIATDSVTSCFHVFNADAIASWLATDESRGTCPTCKQACVVTCGHS